MSKGEADEHVYTISLSIDETRLSFHSPSPIMHPSPLVLRVLFGSERVQGVPASDSFVAEPVISVYVHASL